MSPGAITAVLALSGTVVALMQTLVVPLLPDFPGILGVTADDASWLVTATLLSSAVATPIVSRSADMYGKRKMMVICLAIMVAGSVVAAVGGSFLWLIVGRALQGFSSALIPVGISIMRDELPKEKMGSAVALMSATLGIGSAMGLPLAGLLYESLGWESIFWVSAAAGTLLLAAVVLVVPESKVRTPGRFDYLGAVVLSAALAALLLAISKGGSWGWGSEPVLLLFLAAAVLLAAWVPYELKVSQPMVDLRTSGAAPCPADQPGVPVGRLCHVRQHAPHHPAASAARLHRLRIPAERHHCGPLHGTVRPGHGGFRSRFRRHHPAVRRQVGADRRCGSHGGGLRGPRLLLGFHCLGDYRLHSGQHRHGNRLRGNAHADHGRRAHHRNSLGQRPQQPGARPSEPRRRVLPSPRSSRP